MSPSRSAWPWRILKISSCLRSPLVPWTPSSLATLFRSAMVLSLSSDRFIRFPPAPTTVLGSVAMGSGADGLGEGRFGLRSEEEMVVLRRVACVQMCSVRRLDAVLRESLSHTLSRPVNCDFPRRRAALHSRRFTSAASHPDVDDRPLLDLHQPVLEARVVLLPVEDVADLVAHLDQGVPGQRLARVETEQVIAHLGAERGGDLPGLEAQDRLLDVGRQLAFLDVAQAAPVLAGRILRVLLGHVGEVLALQEEPVDLLRLLARLEPALLALIRIRQHQDVPRREGEPGLELLPVVDQVLVDLLLGDRYAEGDLPADHPLHHELLAEPLLDPLDGEALGLDDLLELLLVLGLELPHDVGEAVVQLRVLDHDLLPLGLLELDAVLDQVLEQPGAQGLAGLPVRDLL